MDGIDKQKQQQLNQQATEVASLSDKISKLESGFQSMQDKLGSIDTFAQNMNRVLTVLDIGQDEGFKSDVLSDVIQSKSVKNTVFANLKRAVDTYLTHEGDMDRLKYDKREERLDSKEKMNARYHDREADLSAFKFLIMMKAATGVDNLNPKDAVTLLEAVRNTKPAEK